MVVGDSDSEGVWVTVKEPEPQGVGLRVTDVVTLKVPLAVMLVDRVPVGEMLPVRLRVGRADAVIVPVTLTDRLKEGEGDKVGVKLTLPVTVPHCVVVGVKVGVLEAHGVDVKQAVEETVAETVMLRVGV